MTKTEQQIWIAAFGSATHIDKNNMSYWAGLAVWKFRGDPGAMPASWPAECLDFMRENNI